MLVFKRTLFALDCLSKQVKCFYILRNLYSYILLDQYWSIAKINKVIICFVDPVPLGEVATGKGEVAIAIYIL